MKKAANTLLLSLILGTLISILQHIVISGFPVQISQDFWGELLFGTVYVYCFLWLVRYLLRSFFSQAIKGYISTNTIIRNFIVVQIVSLIMLFVIGIILAVIISGSTKFRLKDLSSLRFILVYYFFINSILFSISVGIRLYRLYTHEKDAKHQAEKSFMEAQLQMLRQQLNPHFLFNNLNIIASTIKSNPTLAYDFTHSMASFYRKVLESENAGWISLKEELKTIRSYLYMLSVRFEEKLHYDIQISGDQQDRFSVPDFILQPIIENIIKHNSCSRSNPLHIIIRINEKNKLEIRNNYQPKENSAESLGIGWFNIQSRYRYLGAEMPEKYIRDGWFYVEVTMTHS